MLGKDQVKKCCQIWRGVRVVALTSIASVSPAIGATPLPWEWVLDLQQQAEQRNCALWDLRRSPFLSSPSGRWQVYSRLELQVDPQTNSDHLSSVLFARDRQTDELQVIRSVSPHLHDLDFVMLIPISWQRDQLLIREHAGLFQSDIAMDQAVIWTPEQQVIQVIQPPPVEITELLDWDPELEQQVLFAIGQMGENPTVVSLGSSTVLPRSIPIETFPHSVFTPPDSSDPMLQWQLGLPQITGPLCGT